MDAESIESMHAAATEDIATNFADIELSMPKNDSTIDLSVIPTLEGSDLNQITDALHINKINTWPRQDGYFEGGPDAQRTTRNGITDILNHPVYGWVDITKEFFAACAELESGELAQDSPFGLFDAMSAIEIMDPKMDVGMGYNKDAPKPHTFDTAVEAGVLKLEGLLPEEIIGLCDAIFSCLVSWLEGDSMDQVLYTCLYLHAPTRIIDKSLRAFCIAVRSLTLLIRDIILTNAVNEEEDVQLYLNSQFLSNDDLQPIQIVNELKEAEDELVRQSKKLDTPNESWLAVLHRLRFMRHFFRVMHLVDMIMTTTTDEQIINEIYKNLIASIELTPQIKRTICRGTQPHEGSEIPNLIGFSPRIHDRSQPPTFPRTIKIRDRPTSVQYLEDLMGRLKFACKITRHRDYYSVLNFFVDFSRKSSQCILSRSVLQGLFMNNRRLVFGTSTIRDFLCDSIRNFCAPPILNSKHPASAEPRAQKLLEAFLFHCFNSNIFSQFIRICGFNRARQREKLARLIATFDSIQIDAARLDSSLINLASDTDLSTNELIITGLKQSAQFSPFVQYNFFRAMLLYLMLGFELELYSPHEFIYIYWYPYELLINFLVSVLKRVEANLVIQEEYAEQQLKSNLRNNRKARSKKNKKQQRPFRQEIFYYHALISMCGGYCKAMGGLTKDGRIRQPMAKFDNEEIRFNRRFMPFAALSNPVPFSYAEFKRFREETMQPSSSDIYTLAANYFTEARNWLESIQNPESEILDMLQIAKINSVVMNVLAKGHQKEIKRQPEFDFSRHPHYPIIKLN